MTAPTPNAELAYRVTFDRIGRNHNVAPLDVSKVDGPNHLAKLIFDYARPHLGSREVEVVLEEDVRSGWIFVGGFRTAGTFTIEPVAGEVAEIFGPRPEPVIEPGLIEGDTAAEQYDNAAARYDADEAVFLVDHGPVKPPYGTPEREAYDREHGGAS